MSLSDAFAPAEAEYKSRVMCATWGHLAPESGKEYALRFTFACAGYGGNIVVIDSETDAPDSPWLFDHLLSYAVERSRPGQVHTFIGTYRMGPKGAGHLRGRSRRVRT